MGVGTGLAAFYRYTPAWLDGKLCNVSTKLRRDLNKYCKMVLSLVLPSTPFVSLLGGDTEYPLTDLPIEQVLGATHFREAQK